MSSNKTGWALSSVGSLPRIPGPTHQSWRLFPGPLEPSLLLLPVCSSVGCCEVRGGRSPLTPGPCSPVDRRQCWGDVCATHSRHTEPWTAPAPASQASLRVRSLSIRAIERSRLWREEVEVCLEKFARFCTAWYVLNHFLPVLPHGVTSYMWTLSWKEKRLS